MAKISKPVAIKRWLEKDSALPSIKMGEMKEFKVASSAEDWDDFARVSADELGIPQDERDF